MNKLSLLSKIRSIYEDNSNIMQYLRDISGSNQNCPEDIMISYDFQAGSYIEGYVKEPEWKDRYLERLVSIFKELSGKKKSVFEAGVGEATTLVPFLNHIEKDICAGGGDISWSRVKAAQNFARDRIDKSCNLPCLAMMDMFSLPLADSSVDIVYTNHSMEPNGGNEVELLEELYRVAREYLILLEPAYEFASLEAKARMERNGYVRNLYEVAKSLNYDVLTWELYGESANPLNPTGLMIIRKDPVESNIENYTNEIKYVCPLTRSPMEIFGNVYYSKDSMLAYPIINGVPCLLSEYAVVATKMTSYF